MRTENMEEQQLFGDTQVARRHVVLEWKTQFGQAVRI